MHFLLKTIRPKIYWLLILFFVLVSGLLFGQEDTILTQISSIKDRHQKLDAILDAFKSVRNADELGSVRMLNEGLVIAEILHDEKSKAQLLFALGLQWQNIGGFTKASEYYFESLKIFTNLNDQKMRINLLRRIGDNFRSASNLSESARYLQQSLKLALELGDTLEMTKVYNRLAATLFESYANIVQNGFTDTTRNKTMPVDPRSKLFFYKPLFDSLSIVVNEALSLSEKTKNTELKISTLNIMGAFYNCVQSKSDSAYWALTEGIRLAEKLQDVEDLVLLYRNLSGYYRIENQNAKRLEACIKSYRFAEKSGNKILLRIAAEALSSTYRDLGNFKEQSHFLEIAYSLNLFLYNTDAQSKLLLQKAEFEEQRNAEILAAEKKQNSIIVFALIITILLFIAFVSILIHRNRFILRMNKELNKMNLLISKQRDELNSANKSKDKLFSVIAHDLKSPFMGLAGFSKILAEEYRKMPDDELGSSLQEISKTTNNLYDLTLNLLRWAELQLQSNKHNPRVFNLADIYARIVNTFYLNASKKEITISSEFAPEIIVFADIDEIYSVMHNLVSNAIKFTPRGGKIEIISVLQEDFVTVSIQDSGVGMSEELVKVLFWAEGPGSMFGTEGEKGTGLGLLICKEMVQKNNGKIWVVSEIDKGSTFSFTLPLHK